MVAKVLKGYEDFFNEKSTRNENNTEKDEYNCGGYALRTFSWYCPYEYDEDTHPYDSMLQWIEDLIYEEGLSLEEAIETILTVTTEKMLSDFSKKIRVVQKNSHLDEDEELIAFRISTMMDDKWVEEADFHYIVFRDGEWRHKLGDNKVQAFDFTEDPWKTPYFIYNSPIVYLAHKI